MRTSLFALLIAGFSACSSGSSSSSPPTTTPATGSATQPSTGSGTTQATTGPGIGEKCGDGDTCGTGSCVKYYGIAGPSGPEFKSCEIRCDDATPCADGRKCVTVADGPGRVCR
jgi:hypothetical protein